MSYTPKFILKASSIALICGFITGYSYFQAQNLMKGPIITLLKPQAGQAGDVTKIHGEAKNIASITFNGRQIFTDKNGNWSEEFVLSDGYNIIKIAAKDKFGRSTEKIIELVYAKALTGNTLSMITTKNNGKTD
jgi:hypothetical protein